MRKKIFGVCDPNEDYARTLSHYISRKYGTRFSVMAFTSADAIEDFLRTGRFDVLLVSEEFIELADRVEVDESKIPMKSTYVLTDQRETDSYEFPCIYKYQSCETILVKIFSELNKTESFTYRRDGRTRIIGVYSPIHRCYKTTFAFELCRQLAKNESSLFITFEKICGHKEVIKNEGCMGVSDIIYRELSLGRVELPDEIPLLNYDGMDILKAASCPEDIMNTEPSVFADILEAFRTKGIYKNIVVDFGDGIKEPEVALQKCGKVYIPITNDEISAIKISAWEEYMVRNNYSGLVDTGEKIVVSDDVAGFVSGLVKNMR